MKVLIYGASGMVGQGVLREALRDNSVTQVHIVGRSPTRTTHPKLREILLADLTNPASIESQLSGINACFFCLGASAAGMDEAGYTRVNHDIPVAHGMLLSRLNSQMTFVYVSGAGTGSQKAMWAKVKRRTEEALLALPLKSAYMLRPGVIQPLHGVRSKTPMYHAFYAATAPLLTLARKLFPNYVVSSEEIGLVMLKAAKTGAPKSILESADIRALLG
ncbi:MULTISPECIES: NAD(P)H-binding protein [unclassified Pseudomonas]|uniref:NAD(P)H-binding protein n=1 Tax=unclassified Pseudomonas TaxID=196821 RepID=UPI0039B730AA